MTVKTKTTKRLLSIILCLAMLMTYFPMSSIRATAAGAPVNVADVVADPGTAYTWETMMGTDADGNRYAGRVWVDKSVYTHGQTAILNSSGDAGSSFEVSLQDDEAFQIIFSALGSSMTTTTTKSSTGPMDVVLVLDTSTSMDDLTTGNVTRLQRVIEAANTLLEDLLTINNVRIAIVTYNADSEMVIGLDSYTNGIELVVTNYFNNGRADAGVVSAYDKDNRLLGKDSGYTMGTNLQAGIDRGFNILADAENVEGRTPVAIVLTDGQANRAVRDSWYSLSGKSISSVSDERLVLSTLLNAAYNKAKVEANYGVEQKVYSISVDLDESDAAHAIMNPGDPSHGFNSSNSHSSIRTAYSYFTDWASGETVNIGRNNSRWVFDHNYPKPNGLTLQDIVDNINYVSQDAYYDVSSAELGNTFNQIYEELSSGVFNPITSSSTVNGATGVDNTPLIYVDNIGQYMEIKEIQSVTLFGASYSVVKNADGTYTVQEARGVNPTTNENYNTAEDIQITVTENTDGSQKLEITINQEILPIILEQVSDKTVGGVTNTTMAELTYNPLRVYYTVGLSSDILLPTGQVDVSKIDGGYRYIDDTTGQITFYSNAFGQMNPAVDGVVSEGDAHVGFRPSAQNRYYYHQANQGVFTGVSAKDGSAIDWDGDEYGVLYEEGKYSFTYLTYENYKTLADDATVYTYVTYYRPTPSTADHASAAEKVTYIVYTQWGYLKESVGFYDYNANVYVNYDAANGYVTGATGYAIDSDKVDATINAYLADNPNGDVKAVLGIGSLRTSRLHNMTVAKTGNSTGTATLRYAPEYTHETADQHHGNDVVVWLGNNGRMTVSIDTGIALTKSVTEAIGSENDTYALTVTVPAGVTATPVVRDGNGTDITSSASAWQNNVLTVNVKANETVYISGIPAGTECVIGEQIPSGADYYISGKTDTVTVPTLSQVLAGAAQYATASVTNTPRKYGNLNITKEMDSDHNIPAGVLSEKFAITVHVGTALAGKTFAVADSEVTAPYEVTVDANGDLNLLIQARQTLQILNLPEDTQVTVTERLTADQAQIFGVVYRTRNHSGEDADNDNVVTIPAGANATAVITNTYTPKSTRVDLDIAGTKILTADSSVSLPGGSFTFKAQQWNGTGWEDVNGKAAQTVYAVDERGNKTFQIEDVLSGMEYDRVGSWAYQILEVKGDAPNMTYDRTLYTFTVTVTDNDGQLVAAVTDLHNTAITDGTYEVSFENTYHTASVSVDIEKTVDNKSGDTQISKDGFAFTAVQTDREWNVLPGGATLTVYSDAAGNARFAATYTRADSYYYVVSEVNGGAKGWDYSDVKYKIEVKVTDDGTGNLSATLIIDGVDQEGDNARLTFRNTYDPKDTTLDLTVLPKVKKNLEGKILTAGAFRFVLCEDGTVAQVLAGTVSALRSGTNDENGDVRFDKDLTFDKVGKYQYDIAEIIPSGAVYDAASGKYVLKGMYYDPTIYDLVIEVTDNRQTGELEAIWYFEDATTDVVTFHNSYRVTATSYTISGSKTLTGRAMAAGEFSFELYEGDTLLETVTNKADGTFTFSAIPYTQVGTHTYTVREKDGNAPGVTYTGVDHPITVTVTVTDQNSLLTASADVANTNIHFTNSYEAAPAQVTFQGTKTLVGGTLTDNTFSFKLYQTDHTFALTGLTPVGTAKNVQGSFAFATRSLSTPGTYFFVVVEDAADPVDDVVYDSTQHCFRVQVMDDGKGQLLAKVENVLTGSGADSDYEASVTASVSFTNAVFTEVTEKEVYLKDSTTEIDGKKVEAGDVLTYFISYTNYTGMDVVVDIVDSIPRHTAYVDGSASHGGSFAGTHVNWVLNVAKGESVTVSFQVKVGESDAIVANTAVVRDGVNTYTTNEVKNHTVEDEAEKDVFLTDDLTTSVDGQKVKPGDKLTYVVEYVNITGTAQDVTITDEISKYTAYVEGSADNGGVFADGKLTWKLEDVPAWATVRVTFQVTVTEDVDGNPVTNKAVVRDGVSAYVTNQVSNPTDKPEIPTVTPPTGDEAQLVLWAGLLLGSALAVVALVTGKKKLI